MIIVRLIGGLGNQMFQYATARRLAHRHDALLKLDISDLSKGKNWNTPREYTLYYFNIEAEIASTSDVVDLRGESKSKIKNGLDGFFQVLGMPARNTRVMREKHFHFDQTILEAPDNVYLDGYWQSEKYFKDIKNILQKEFTLKNPLEGKNLDIAEEIRRANSVSLHVRRADYVTDQRTTEFHGLCGPDYYNACVDVVCRSVADPHFFVFSDDPDWVKGNIKLRFPTTFITHNEPKKGHEDLRLMCMCQHHIIANSSFSWWGSWLCPHPEKIVIAPRKWFNDETIHTDDLIPDRWIRI
jgi:hypothetical protein